MTATLMNRKDEIREKALKDLQQFQVLMLDGHFDFGNGYHGRLYLNPHQLFRYPSTIWRFAQDLIDILPASVLDHTDVVAGPATGVETRRLEHGADVTDRLIEGSIGPTVDGGRAGGRGDESEQQP